MVPAVDGDFVAAFDQFPPECRGPFEHGADQEEGGPDIQCVEGLQEARGAARVGPVVEGEGHVTRRSVPGQPPGDGAADHREAAGGGGQVKHLDSGRRTGAREQDPGRSRRGHQSNRPAIRRNSAGEAPCSHCGTRSQPGTTDSSRRPVSRASTASATRSGGTGRGRSRW